MTNWNKCRFPKKESNFRHRSCERMFFLFFSLATNRRFQWALQKRSMTFFIFHLNKQTSRTLHELWRNYRVLYLIAFYLNLLILNKENYKMTFFLPNSTQLFPFYETFLIYQTKLNNFCKRSFLNQFLLRKWETTGLWQNFLFFYEKFSNSIPNKNFVGKHSFWIDE